MAGHFDSVFDSLEVFVDHNPMSGRAPMVRGRVTYRGPQEVIGICYQECSHPQITMFGVGTVSCLGRQRLEGEVGEGVNLEE